MTPGYILHFHSDEENAYVCGTLDPVKATLAYRNTIKQHEDHDDVVVELYGAKFEDGDKEQFANQVVDYYSEDFTSPHCELLAVFTKLDGKIVADGQPIHTLRPTS